MTRLHTHGGKESLEALKLDVSSNLNALKLRSCGAVMCRLPEMEDYIIS